MAKKKRWKLKTGLERGDEGDRDGFEFMRTMARESDRGCLLVGLSKISDTMENLLGFSLSQHDTRDDAEWLLDPSGGSRPLANLAVRTRVAACLGLIDPQIRNLVDGLRNLRNDRAHEIYLFEINADSVETVLENCSVLLRAAVEKVVEQLDWEAIMPGISEPKKTLVACINIAVVAIFKKHWDLTLKEHRRHSRHDARRRKKKG